MFFNVNDSFSYVEVYGVKNEIPQLIDPHDIFRTRTIMFDNIHRNILSTVSRKEQGPAFCRFLRWRFPYFDKFLVSSVYHPDIIESPYKRSQQVRYQCVE